MSDQQRPFVPQVGDRPQTGDPLDGRANVYQLTFYEVVMSVKRRWWLVAICTLTCLVGAALYAFLTKPVYRAEATLIPTSSNDRTASGGLAGQLGGLASLAGLSLGDSGGRKIESVATLQSRVLTDAFVSENNLLPVLFASRWDAAAQTWKKDEKPPTLWDANKLISDDVRKVSEDKKTGLITLAVEWTDPALAAQWASDLVARTNRRLRQAAIEQSDRNIAFLKTQIDATSIVEMRQALYSVMESELKTGMLAQSSEDYAFKVLDPAVVPEQKVWPKRLLVLLLGVIVGLLISAVFLVLAEVRSYLRRQHQLDSAKQAP